MNSKPRVVNHSRLLVYKDGLPSPVYHEPLTVPAAEQMIKSTAAMPYLGEEDPNNPGSYIIEERFEGASNFEVMCVRIAEAAAQGNEKAINIMLDRILGRPKQSIESKSMTMTYKDYLDQIAQELEPRTIRVEDLL